MMSWLQLILPQKNWRHLGGNRSGIHSPDWARSLCLFDYHSNIKTHLTALIICRIYSFTALSLHLQVDLLYFQTSPQWNYQPGETFRFELILNLQLSSAFKDLKRRNFLCICLPLRASVQSSGEQLGDVWHHRCPQPILRWQWYHRGNTPPPPFPFSAASLLCGRMMSSFQLRLGLTDWLINTLTQRLTGWMNEWMTQWVTAHRLTQ